MSQKLLQALQVAIAFVALLGFASIYAYGLFKVWNHSQVCPPPAIVFPNAGTAAPGDRIPTPADADFPTYLASMLAGLVGGVVAVAFGIDPPKSARGLTLIRDMLLAAYVVVYLSIGLAAIVTRVVLDSCAPDLIKNVASAVLGMSIPIVVMYFQRKERIRTIGSLRERLKAAGLESES